MLTTKVKSKASILILVLMLFGVIVYFLLRALEDNVIYFYSPSEIKEKTDISFNKNIRVGGLVKKGSTNEEGITTNFILTDLKNEIIVSYEGLLPNLFSEGKGVVAEGKLKDKKYFVANKILAKHDENYMPPEVSKALKKSKY